MNHQIINIIIISIVISLVSCDKGLFDAGPSETRVLAITENFSLILINKTFDIELVQDTVNKIWITSGANLQPDIIIYVKSDTLYLDNDIKFNWSRKYEKIKLEMHLVSIPKIQIMEPSYITTRDTFKTDHFQLEDWGKFSDAEVTIDANTCSISMSEDNFGKFVVKGKAVQADLWACGSCFVYADELQTQNCNVLNQGIGDIYVNVSNLLTGSINSAGNVYYSGQPNNITIQNHSSGKLISLSK